MPTPKPLQIFLCGDVMTGRGIDQILSHPSEPHLYESYVKDARDYVWLAEKRNGKIPRGIQGDYLWGDGLNELNNRQPNLRIINLETSITSSNTPWLHKGINYRMHPKNIDAITAAKIDVCVLANNHVLDWGLPGFLETMAALNKAQIHYAGAGERIQHAQAPAVLSAFDFPGRILIFSMGLSSSGIPHEWSASSEHPGIWLLDNLSARTILHIKKTIEYYRQSNDLCIVSIHWGGNWGYDIPMQHQQFAHALIDEAGVHAIHGHSSHHPIAIEIHNHCPIFYGCGDLINDYEGISGWEQFKDELSLMYFLTFDKYLRLDRLELVPFARKNFKLHYANATDCQWMTRTLINCSELFHTSFELEDSVIYCF